MSWKAILAACLSSTVASTPVGGQSASAWAGWVSLVTTPVGAFAPSVYLAPPDGNVRAFGVQARYSHWQFAPDDDNTTNVGVAAAFSVRDGRLSFELGRTTKKDCSDCDALMFGSAFSVPVLTTDAGLVVVLNPELGYMTETGDSDFSAAAGALSVPLYYEVAASTDVRLVPFASPGVGFGGWWRGDNSESGGRFFLGGGAALVHLASGLQLTASLSRIIIADGATVFGVAVGFGR